MTAVLTVLILVFFGFVVGVLPRLMMLGGAALYLGFLLYGLYGPDAAASVNVKFASFIALNSLPFLLVGFCIGLWRKRKKRLMTQERKDA